MNLAFFRGDNDGGKKSQITGVFRRPFFESGWGIHHVRWHHNKAASAPLNRCSFVLLYSNKCKSNKKKKQAAWFHVFHLKTHRRNIGLGTKQELVVCGCVLLKGYNNDRLQPGAPESCIKANVCLFKWLVNDKVGENKPKSIKSLLTNRPLLLHIITQAVRTHRWEESHDCEGWELHLFNQMGNISGVFIAFEVQGIQF